MNRLHSAVTNALSEVFIFFFKSVRTGGQILCVRITSHDLHTLNIKGEVQHFGKYTCQTQSKNKCWKCTLLQTTHMLKLNITVCSILSFML